MQCSAFRFNQFMCWLAGQTFRCVDGSNGLFEIDTPSTTKSTLLPFLMADWAFFCFHERSLQCSSHQSESQTDKWTDRQSSRVDLTPGASTH